MENIDPEVYQQLRKIARRHLARERAGHSFRPTELVNEALLRLGAGGLAGAREPAELRRLAAHIMRNILVSYARRRDSAKRGGPSNVRAELDTDDLAGAAVDLDVILDVESAIKALEGADPLGARILELCVYGGYRDAELAEELGLTLPKLKHRKAAAVQLLRGLLDD